MSTNEQEEIFQNLVGSVSKVKLKNIFKNVEIYLTKHLGLFIPYLDYCDYAITPQHTHPAYSFIYNFSGSALVKVGKEIRESPFGKNASICAFSPLVPHEEIIEDQFRSYIAVLIDRDFYDIELKCYEGISKHVFKADFFPANESILNALKRFMIEYREDLPGKEKILHAISLEITHLLIRHCHSIKIPETTISQKIEINQLIQYLNEKFANKITVEEMSKHVNLSPSHFARIFKEETGYSPMDFLINLRIQKAKKYLLNMKYNITDVAYNCGFSSSAYFSTIFFERTGITPTNYRKKQMLV